MNNQELQELIVKKIKENSPDAIISTNEYRGEFSLLLNKANIIQVCKLLKEDPEFQFILCEDVSGVDWARRKNRFTVVYHIFSVKLNYRLRLKVDIDESELNVDSVSSIWPTANWHEREAYDMFGIIFNNHPDLRRMYMPEDFEYFPLRKEFPLMGIPGSQPLPKKERT